MPEAGTTTTLTLNFRDEENGVLTDPSTVRLDVTRGSEAPLIPDYAGPWTYQGSPGPSSAQVYRVSAGVYALNWPIPPLAPAGVYVATWTIGYTGDQFLAFENFPVTPFIPAGGAPIPTTDLVAPAWVASIDGLTADGVGNVLPPDDRTWAANGYVLVPATVGGSPWSTGPVRRPVCQVECWATTPGSSRPPWGKAAQLAEQIRLATYDRHNFGRPLSISYNGVAYAGARVLGATMLTEPRRTWGDIADYAGVLLDLQLDWIAAGEVLV